MVKVNHGGLKLNGTHRLVVYADDDNILGGSVHNTEKIQRSECRTRLQYKD
jgi:hypothetical protein